MTPSNEHWWERVPRIVGGWGFALLIFFKFPFPEAELLDGTIVLTKPGLVAWGIYVVLIVFAIGIAHSTVTGIVLGNVTKAIASVRRAWKGKRSSVETRLDSPPPSPRTLAIGGTDLHRGGEMLQGVALSNGVLPFAFLANLNKNDSISAQWVFTLSGGTGSVTIDGGAAFDSSMDMTWISA